MRDHLYTVPSEFPEAQIYIKKALELYPVIEWMAEFNTNSVSKLKSLIFAGKKLLNALFLEHRFSLE